MWKRFEIKKPAQLISLQAATVIFPSELLAITATNAISVKNPHVFDAPIKAESAVYMRLINNSLQARELVRAESLMSQVFELRGPDQIKGSTRVKRLAKIDIPVKGMVRLEPYGPHIMMIGLKRELRAGCLSSLFVREVCSLRYRTRRRL